MTQVVPAIIPKDFNHMHGQVVQVKDYVDRVQVDIMDGRFAPEPSWPFKNDHGEFEALLSQREGLPFWKEVTYEFDLMVENPEEIFDEYIQIGASALIFHHDSTDKLDELIQKAHEAKIEAGVAFKPVNFSQDVAFTHWVKEADFIQIMGNNNIGHHGVTLDPEVYEFAENLRRADSDIDIAVDIGVNERTAPELIASGVTKLVSGSAIFHSPDVAEAIEQLSRS